MSNLITTEGFAWRSCMLSWVEHLCCLSWIWKRYENPSSRGHFCSEWAIWCNRLPNFSAGNLIHLDSNQSTYQRQTNKQQLWFLAGGLCDYRQLLSSLSVFCYLCVCVCVFWEEGRVVEETTKENSLNHLNKAKAHSTGISRMSSKLSETLTFQVSNELLTIWPLTSDDLMLSWQSLLMVSDLVSHPLHMILQLWRHAIKAWFV